MIAVDTNVLIRAFVEDGREQSEVARRFLTEDVGVDNPAWVSIVVIAETVWLLRNRFGFGNAEARGVISRLLDAIEIIVEQRTAVAAALALEGVDFADALIHCLGRSAGCTKTVTFDRKFARAAGVELLA